MLVGAVFGYLLLSPIVDKFLQNKTESSKSMSDSEQIETEDDQGD